MNGVRVRRSSWLALGALLFAASPTVLFAAKVVEPLGQIRQVNSTRAQDDRPAIASDALGNTAVVWAGLATDTSPRGIYLRGFDSSSGRAVDDNPLRVDDNALEFVDEPAVAMAPGGEIVVVWQGTPGGSVGHDIYARRYGADHQPLDSPPLRINTSLPGDQRDPAVAVGPDGEIVVTWTSDRVGEPGLADIRGRRFSFSAAPGQTELEFTVFNSSDSSKRLGGSAVAMTTQGRFVVVWDDDEVGAGDILARALNDDGPVEEPFIVPGLTVGEQQRPSVAMNARGNYVVAWQDPSDVFAPRVAARLFSFPGVPNDPPPDGLGIGGPPQVSIDARGRFVLVWSGSASDPGLRGRLFRPNGRALGREFLVGFRPEVASVQGSPSVALDADGDFSVSFYGSISGSADAVWTRRFRGPEPIDLAAVIEVRPPRLAPGGEARFIVGITNLHAQENLTGIEAIDRAIGAAVGQSLVVDLPSTQAHIGRRMDFVPGGEGRCRRDEVTGDYFCLSENPLPAGERALVKFGLVPEISGHYAVSVRAFARSLDPETGNNAATDEIEAVEP